MLEACLAGDSSEPVGVVAKVFLGRLAVDDIVGVHEVEFLAPL